MMKKLLENIILLSGMKFFDFFIPLLVIPYVISKIGMDSYGVFAVCLTIFNFVLTLNDFGVNTLLSKKIAQKNSKYTNEEILLIYTNIKIIISLVSSLILLVLAYLKGGDYIFIVCFFVLGALFETASPIAYFQGIQKLRLVSLSQFICRIMSAILVFVLVKKSSDLYLYAFLHNLSYIVNCIFLVFLLNKEHSIRMRFVIVPRKHVQRLLHEAWHIYSFRFMSGLINPCISIFIAACYGSQVVTIYSVSQRVCSAASRLYEPMNNAIFPYISSIVDKSYTTFKKQSYLYILFLLSSSVISCYLLVLFGGYIQKYLIGREFTRQENLLYVLSILILIPSVVNMYLTYMIIVLNRTHVIKINFFISMLSLLMGLFLIYVFKLDDYLVALMLLITSLVLTIGLVFSLHTELQKRNSGKN